MDPNETLRRLRELCALDNCRLVAEEIADLEKQVEEWLSKGGFLPEEWKAAGRYETR